MMIEWRKWSWIRKLAHWILLDYTTNLTHATWFEEVDQLVHQAGGKKKYTGKMKRQWVHDQLLNNYSRRGEYPPRESQLNMAIEFLVSGW